MNVDMKKEFSLQGSQHTSLTEGLLKLATWIKNIVIQYWQQYLLRYAIRSERRTLAKLDDRELDDIGINRVAAVAESNRRFSDLPSNRYQ